jgi:hypothetical protein
VRPGARAAAAERYAKIRPFPGGLPDQMVAKYLIRRLLLQYDRGMT